MNGSEKLHLTQASSLLQLSRYNQLGIHRAMLRDRVRCDTYRRAMAKTVKPGDIVLDVGAGTGILSLFALQAGAEKVYAVEATNIVDVARAILTANSVEQRVILIHQEVESLELPQKVDLIVSEWLGGLAIDENFLGPLLIARDRWLKPGGVILPERVTVWMCPVRHPQVEDIDHFWRSRPYDVDLSIVAEITMRQQFATHKLSPQSFFSEPQALLDIDLRTFRANKADSVFESEVFFTVTRTGIINALAAWFVADFGFEIFLSTAPDAPKTHWGQTIFPLENPLRIERETKLVVRYVCKPAGFGHCLIDWDVRADDCGSITAKDSEDTNNEN